MGVDRCPIKDAIATVNAHPFALREAIAESRVRPPEDWHQCLGAVVKRETNAFQTTLRLGGAISELMVRRDGDSLVVLG